MILCPTINNGDIIYLIGESRQELGASELSYMFREESGGQSGIGGIVPSIEPERNLATYKILTKAMHSGLVASAHDCSDGGLAVAIAESCIGIDSGADIEISALRGFDDELDKWGALFGESLGRILVSVSPENSTNFESFLTTISYTRIGVVNNNDNLIVTDKSVPILSKSIPELRAAWKGTLDGGAPE